MNPDSGEKPPVGGASADGRAGGKHRRRRRAKRGGKPPVAPSSVRGAESALPADARRSDTHEQGAPRKRKRRRARAGRPAGSPPANQDQTVQAVAQSETPRDAPTERGAPKSGKRRNGGRKNREGRGLQGRPLTSGAASAGSKNGQPARSGSPKPSGSAGRAASAGAVASSRQAHARSSTAAHSERRLPAVPETLTEPRRRPHNDDLYAALDLGTNNCRLLIAQPTRPGQFRVVDAFSRIVRLGEGLAATGRLSDDAMDRAVEALRVCAAKLAARQIRKMRLIATEACRAAENGEVFLERVTRETGLTLEIIDRETEARLAVSGCSSLVGREARSVVLFDIGGGSSEIAVLRIQENRSSRLANHITHWTSLPVGVVTLSERHGGKDVTPAIFESMVEEVQNMLAGFECPPVGDEVDKNADADFHLIGTSGTVTTLAGVHLDLPRYDRRKVDGLWLSDTEVNAMQAKLLSWDFEGRASNPCIGPDRADLVLAGCAILEAIRRRWPARRMRVADRGLREGLLTDMMADDGVWRRARGRRHSEQTARGATEMHR